MTSDDKPLPLVSVTEAQVEQAHGEKLRSPNNPLGCAYLWWAALQDPLDRSTLDLLAAKPSVWGDYSQAAELLRDLSMTTTVQDCAGHADIGYVKFIEYAGTGPAKAFESTLLTKFVVLTVVQPAPDSEWRVWGISENFFPSAKQVLGS